MKTNAFIKLTLLSQLAFAPTFLAAQNRADTLAVQSIIQQEVIAWNKGDAVAYAQSFSPNGTLTNVQGLFFTGKKIFQEKHDQIFKGFFRQTVFQQKIVSLRLLSPTVAVVETLATVSGFATTPPPGTHLDAKGQLNTRLLQVLVKEANDWKIMVYHNVDIKPGIPIPDSE